MKKLWKGRWQQWPKRFLRMRRDPKANKHMTQKYWDDLFESTREEIRPMLAQNRCNACKGVFHEATGHRHSDNTVLCGPCAKHFFKWVKGHTNRSWSGVKFYEHAVRPSPNSKVLEDSNGE